MPCLDCRKDHGIWSCPKLNRRKVADSLNFAKHNQLCFQCLAQGHQGKACPLSRQCGKDGCTDLHHRLLHFKGSTRPTGVNLDKSLEIIGTSTIGLQDRDSSITEGKSRRQLSLKVTSEQTL